MEPLFLEVPEAYRAVRLGRTEFLKRVYSGEIQSVRLGRRRLIPAQALRQWAQEQCQAAQTGQAAGHGDD